MTGDVAAQAALCAVLLFVMLGAVFGVIVGFRVCCAATAVAPRAFDAECVGVHVVGAAEECALCNESFDRLLEFGPCQCRNRVCAGCAMQWSARLLELHQAPWCPFCRGGLVH